MKTLEVLDVVTQCHEQSGARLMLAVLGMLSYDGTREVCISLQGLANLLHWSQRNVMKALRALREAGYITVKHSLGDDGGQTANTYVIAAPGGEK